ncbi:hypothetical protein QFC22_001008 [Naganishia vaughanmartiniae]|uniref:Uncharacterized protein n=1 Tax=Naganishia vaughanmartiniae TaxID=1424756 RepID=A0ACC2XJM3_9TREE|nr:hypothetical protein QFC22_001008 [Naganishia vaughanmartiniae]
MNITEVMRSILNGGAANPEAADAHSNQENAVQNKRTESSAPVLSSKFKTGGFKKAFVPVDMDVTPFDPLAPTPAVIDADLDGEAMEMDLDGEAMEMDDDIDGVALDGADDEDLDGEAIVE